MLNKLNTYRPNEDLESFKKRFYERYGDNEIPLLIALDSESGLLYPNVPRKPISQLVSDLSVVQRERDTTKHWGKVESYLNEKLLSCLSENKNVIKITDEDLKDFDSNWHNMPLSFYVMFRSISSNDATLFIETVGGASGVNLLSRFAHADTDIRNHIKIIADIEKAHSDQEIIAEIVHLPEDRVGNILIHPPIRDYEIPYLARSSKNSGQQIKLSDILVSVRNNKIILRSKSLDKVVKPRLSNAHNYKLNALPVYRFLADIQFQDVRSGLGLSWGELQKQHTYFPRVQYKQVILQLAQWKLKTDEIVKLKGLEFGMLRDEIAIFRSKWNITDKVVLAESDNELLIDFTNETSIRLLIDTISSRKYFVLKEFVEPSNIVSSENGVLTNQFISIFHKKLFPKQITNQDKYLSIKDHNLAIQKKAQPKFLVGSEWIYYKFYCGEKSADKVLTECIFRILEVLTENTVGYTWFFIRYNDPMPHIRFRINVKNIEDIGKVIALVNSEIKSYAENGLIWKVQLDTYEREISRYGSSSIESVEKLFYFDSECTLKILNYIRGRYYDSERWLICLKAIDSLLAAFSYSITDKESLLFLLKSAFNDEFKTDIAIKKRINDKYRTQQKKINNFMSNETTDRFIAEALTIKTQKMEGVVSELLINDRCNKLEVSVKDLLRSLIHMMVNRIIISDSRLHELVIYDFLYQYYRSKRYKLDKTNPIVKSA